MGLVAQSLAGRRAVNVRNQSRGVALEFLSQLVPVGLHLLAVTYEGTHRDLPDIGHVKKV